MYLVSRYLKEYLARGLHVEPVVAALVTGSALGNAAHPAAVCKVFRRPVPFKQSSALLFYDLDIDTHVS